MTNRIRGSRSFRLRRSCWAWPILACAVFGASASAQAATPYFALFYAEAPKISTQIEDPARLCVPFRFWSDQSQPILVAPGGAFGACSDAIQFLAFLDVGEIAVSAQLASPYLINVLPGTEISYVLLNPYVRQCDNLTTGLPFPIQSPCRLLSVTATDALVNWHFEDATGNVSFQITGNAPRAFLPEPNQPVALAWALLGIRALGRRRTGIRRFEPCQARALHDDTVSSDDSC